MDKKNSKNLSSWRKSLKKIKTFLKPFLKNLDKFNKKYPNINQMIQISFIYFFAVVDLHFAVLSNVFMLGYFPDLLAPFFPIIQGILQNPILKIWASPEKVFFMSYLVIEIGLIRNLFKLSKLVRYNILLIFALLMVQGLTVSYWDLIFNRTVAVPVVKYMVDQGILLNQDKTIAIFFFFNTFVFFMGLYSYLYYYAMKGKFSYIPNCEWLFDSVAFWLKIKTPSMKYGNRKKRKNPDEN